ncbi:PTS sugar transporter subunit IIC [Faecalitalea cylindroides]|uniref:PTS sugar transporter subunit IIC n=1 Tax=Faecalitalea cylindroides TaxID=39483 RepID=UPI0026745BAE|nr:PTS transporter subunit EIIC [Faecalitalea cylindroides]
MAKFTEKFEDGLMIVAEKVDDNKYLGAIKNAFTTFMPFIIVGSFASLFNTLICSTSTGLAVFIPALAKISPAFTAINFATLSIMALPICFLIGSELAKRNKVPEHICAITSLVAFLCVVPQSVSIVVEGLESAVSGAGLPGDAIGAQGLFIAMIISVLVSELFSALMKIDKIKIKMPASVPAAISQSFNTLIPILVSLVVVGVAGQLFFLATGTYMNSWIYSVVQAPLEAIFQSPFGAIALFMIAQVFWFLGIHGNMIITPIRNPLIASALAANIATAAAGGVPDQPITYGALVSFIVVGGAGLVLSLIIAILLFSKRDDEKAVAKLGLIPGLFGISEPVVFGLPLVLNVTYAIPFILSAGLATGCLLFATSIGFVPCNIVDVPFGFPIVVSAFIGHGWQGVVLQLVILALGVLLYTPFVLMSNKQYQREQEKLNAEKE